MIGTSALASAVASLFLQRGQLLALAAALAGIPPARAAPRHCRGAAYSVALCRSSQGRPDRPARPPRSDPGRAAARPVHGAADASTPKARCRTDCRRARRRGADVRRPRHIGPGDRQARRRAAPRPRQAKLVVGLLRKRRSGGMSRQMPMKPLALPLRPRRNPRKRRMRDALGIVLHGGGQHIKPGLLGHRFVDDFLPAAEAHQHMRSHGVITFHRLGQLGPVRKATTHASSVCAPCRRPRAPARTWPRNMQVNIIRCRSWPQPSR